MPGQVLKEPCFQCYLNLLLYEDGHVRKTNRWNLEYHKQEEVMIFETIVWNGLVGAPDFLISRASAEPPELGCGYSK